MNRVNKLVSKIQGMSKQKRIPATIIDVLGSKCSVRLSTRGTVLRNLSYFGPAPVSGDSCYVDYGSGVPTVMTSGAITEEASTPATSSVRGGALESGAAKFHNDLPGLQGGLAATEVDPAEYYHLTADEYAGLGGGPGGSGIPITAAGGTADAITADYTPNITLTDQQFAAFVATAANATTTPTFAPDGLTAHTIVKKGGSALVAGDIPGALAVCILEYNLANTRWELLNPAAGGTGGGHIIYDEASPLTQRSKLKFTGTGVTVTDDGGGDFSVVTIPSPATNQMHIDCSAGTSDTYGVLGGAVNGVNTTFTVSEAIYLSGSLKVYRNGQLQTQGSAEDWHEHDPSTGVFHFATAPLSTDVIIVTYYVTDTVSLVGTVEEAPDNNTAYVRKNEAWVPETYLYMDQSGGTGDTCGVLSGTLNGVNTDFTTAHGAYISGTLQVYLNGVLQIQGTTQDWVELSPSAGTFQFNIAPASTDEIFVIYGYSGVITVVGDKHIIQDNGSNKTARAKLDFIGTVVTDNSGSDRTEVDASKVMHAQMVFTIEGLYLAVANQGLKPLKIELPYVGAGATIEKVTARLNTTPGAANLRLDIHKNGVGSIFSGTEYIEIAPTGYTVSRTTNFVSSGAIAENDFFQLELVQGDATAADLVVRMQYKWTLTNV